MENASKALLIAGAVLIVIGIVSLGIRIIINTNELQEVGKQGLDSVEKLEYIKKFNKYINNDATYLEVKQCIAEIMMNNSKDNTQIIELELGKVNGGVNYILDTPLKIKECINEEDNQYIGSGNQDSKYDINCRYNEEGILESIVILKY